MSRKKSSELLDWFPVNAAKNLSDQDLLVLTPEAYGVFWMLRLFCWKDGSVPADARRLAILCRTTEERIVDIVSDLEHLLEPHPEEPGRLIMPLVEADREVQTEKHERRRRAGASRGKKAKGSDAEKGSKPKKATPATAKPAASPKKPTPKPTEATDEQCSALLSNAAGLLSNAPPNGTDVVSNAPPNGTDLVSNAPEKEADTTNNAPAPESPSAPADGLISAHEGCNPILDYLRRRNGSNGNGHHGPASEAVETGSEAGGGAMLSNAQQLDKRRIENREEEKREEERRKDPPPPQPSPLACAPARDDGALTAPPEPAATSSGGGGEDGKGSKRRQIPDEEIDAIFDAHDLARRAFAELLGESFIPHSRKAPSRRGAVAEAIRSYGFDVARLAARNLILSDHHRGHNAHGRRFLDIEYAFRRPETYAELYQGPDDRFPDALRDVLGIKRDFGPFGGFTVGEDETTPCLVCDAESMPGAFFCAEHLDAADG